MITPSESLYFQNILQQILSSSKNQRVKIALLKSLKEQLHLQIKEKMKRAMLQEAKKEKSIELSRQGSESLSFLVSKSISLQRSSCLQSSSSNQHEKKKAIMKYLCSLFEKRGQINQAQYRIQKSWNKNNEQQKVLKDKLLQQKRISLKNKKDLVKQMTEVSTRFEDLKERIKASFENYQQLIKILRVKYLQKKELKLKQKKKIVNISMKNFTKTANIDSLLINDENTNQIMVNL